MLTKQQVYDLIKLHVQLSILKKEEKGFAVGRGLVLFDRALREKEEAYLANLPNDEDNAITRGIIPGNNKKLGSKKILSLITDEELNASIEATLKGLNENSKLEYEGKGDVSAYNIKGLKAFINSEKSSKASPSVSGTSATPAAAGGADKPAAPASSSLPPAPAKAEPPVSPFDRYNTSTALLAATLPDVLFTPPNGTAEPDVPPPSTLAASGTGASGSKSKENSGPGTLPGANEAKKSTSAPAASGTTYASWDCLHWFPHGTKSPSAQPLLPKRR
jgi:hypothetical protein